MTVEGPQARVVSVEGYHHSPTRRHEYGVAHRAREALAVDLDDLELMAMQMHRMGHSSLVDETISTRSPLAIGNGGTSGVHATLLIDQMYFAMSPVRFSV